MIKNIIIASVAVVVLSGCQTMKSNSTQKLYGEPAPVAENEISLKILNNCDRHNMPYHLTPSTIEIKERARCDGNSGSVYSQRNEFATPIYSSSTTGKVVFDSVISYTAENHPKGRAFTLFQVHPMKGIRGCAPPLSVDVITIPGYKYLPPRIDMYGEWKNKKTGKCFGKVQTDRPINAESSKIDYKIVPFGEYDFKTDGTPQHIRIEIDLYGDGNFKSTMFIEGKKLVESYFNMPWQKEYYKPTGYSFKFGHYSYEKYSYTMKFDNTVFKLVK